MAGVPHHAAAPTSQRLLDQGFKVAICEQMADPRTVKGIVPREVVRVVTPGIALDETRDRRAQEPLPCGARAGPRRRVGLAALDSSTGELFAASARPGSADRAARDRAASTRARCSRRRRDDRTSSTGAPRDVSPRCRERRPFDAPRGPRRERCSPLRGAEARAGRRCASDLPRASPRPARRPALRARAAKPDLAHVTGLVDPSSATRSCSTTLDAAAPRARRRPADGEPRGARCSTCSTSRRPPWAARLLRELAPRARSRDRSASRPARRRRGAGLRDAARPRRVRERARSRARPRAHRGRVAVATARAARPRGARPSLGRCRARPTAARRLPRRSAACASSPRSSIRRLRPRRRIAPHRCDRRPPPLARATAASSATASSRELDELRAPARRTATRLIVALEERERAQAAGIPSLKVALHPRLRLLHRGHARAPREGAPDCVRKQTHRDGRALRHAGARHDSRTSVAARRGAPPRPEAALFVELREAAGREPRGSATSRRALAALDVAAPLRRAGHRHDYVTPRGRRRPSSSPSRTRATRWSSALAAASRFVPNDVVLERTSAARRASLITGPNMAGKSTFMRQVALARAPGPDGLVRARARRHDRRRRPRLHARRRERQTWRAGSPPSWSR